jgi:hypothetical protein
MTRHSVATWTPSLYSLKRPSCIGAASVRCVVPSASDGVSCVRPAELLENITKNALPEEMQETLLLVAQLFETQPQQAGFPDKALKVDRLSWRWHCVSVHSTMCTEAHRATAGKHRMMSLRVGFAVNLQHLVKVADLASELARAVGGSTPLAPLLRALLPTLARASPAVSTHAPAGTHTCSACAAPSQTSWRRLQATMEPALQCCFVVQARTRSWWSAS